MNYFKKLNYNDVMNLVEGVVSEVYVSGDVKIVCAGKSSLLLSYGVNGNQKCSDFGNSECSIFGIKTTVLLASAVQ